MLTVAQPQFSCHALLQYSAGSQLGPRSVQTEFQMHLMDSEDHFTAETSAYHLYRLLAPNDPAEDAFMISLVPTMVSVRSTVACPILKSGLQV